MFSVKLECKGVSICYGCLSTDRKIVLLSNNLDVFLNLLGVQQEFYTTQVLLCWECVAHLKNIRTFQNRIQHAQFILQQSLYDLEDLAGKSLSNLSTATKKFYDNSIVYEEPIVQEEKNAKQDIKTYIKQENTDSDDDSNQLVIDDSYSDNELLTIDFNKLKQLEIIEDNIKKEQEIKINETKYNIKINERNNKKNQSIKKYASKATVKTLDVNEDDLKKLFVKVILTEKEIDDILTRDKRRLGGTKLPHKCSVCKSSYKRGVDMRRHVTFNHTKPTFPTKCLQCKMTIRSWDSLHEHWKKHNGYYRCDRCEWVSHSLAAMTTHHHRVHTTVYCCNTCDVTSRTLKEFSEHYKQRHERIICDHCGKSFIKKRTLEVHIKRHHTPATCLECNKTYAHYHVLENHYRMYHPQKIRADNRTELAYCVECDKQFPSVYKYRRHLATAAKHTPPKPVRVPCPECDKVFARKIRMTNHYNSVHRNTTKHRCDICNKTFCSAFSARTHRQHVHEKIPMPKNKMCDICGRGFSVSMHIVKTHLK
ncbi:unnamed protein product [Chilo suppressalis]|uniref:C2H2-type domain-containing protein n=1 Tax=Chilo suppressalis TaxID=168631 RepID=A0ABN8L5G5_CHISP|nr:unnamed protein product [Chilo suppressalis]